jgi:hypothetical protein
MVQQHLNELRSVVEQAADLPEDTRARLLQLTAELERDVQVSGKPDAPKPPVPPTQPTTDEAVPATVEPSGVGGLVTAIEGLETSHPEVTAAVSNVARMLSKLGF